MRNRELKNHEKYYVMNHAHLSVDELANELGCSKKTVQSFLDSQEKPVLPNNDEVAKLPEVPAEQPKYDSPKLVNKEVTDTHVVMTAQRAAQGDQKFDKKGNWVGDAAKVASSIFDKDVLPTTPYRG